MTIVMATPDRAEDDRELTAEEMRAVSGGLDLPLFRGHFGIVDDSVEPGWNAR